MNSPTISRETDAVNKCTHYILTIPDSFLIQEREPKFMLIYWLMKLVFVVESPTDEEHE
jgi:hypothetical protein